MPRINRIRITNFTYVNRHIVDETFNFYDGENALLSLANGGGKSVLVQTVFQPIVPKVKLLERNFANFFAGKKGPAYIMIEWLLDNDSGYLLTGIAMSASESYSPNQEDESLNLNYYTFTNQYEKANSFDIKSIPVTEKDLNGIIVCGYADFRKKIQAQAGSKKYDIKYYANSKQDQIEYERLLDTYSISRNEWKELMVNINENEHGVSGVFKDCKNSRQVMEQWIIRYIEKVLDKSSRGDNTDHQKLEIMMNQVAFSEVENENIISRYNEIDRIISGFEEIKSEAVETVTCIEEVEKRKRKLAGIYFLLTDELEEMKRQSSCAKDSIERKNEESRLLEIEEISDKIYFLEDGITNLNEECKKHRTKLEKVNSEQMICTRDLNIQKGACEHERLKEKQKKRSRLKQDLDNIAKNKNELIDEMNKVKYSLKSFYSKQINDFNQEKELKDRKIEETKSDKQKTEQDINKSHKDINTLSAERGSLKSKIKAFLDYEKKTYEEIGISLYRNPLIGELDSKNIEDVKNKFVDIIIEIEKKLVHNSDKIVADQNEIENLELDEHETSNLRDENSKDLYQIQTQIKEYEGKKKKIGDIVAKYCNSEFDVFERAKIYGVLNEQHSSWNRKYLNLDVKINELSKIINGINENRSFIPASLVSVMTRENIEVYTGESYLRGLAIDERKKVIERNPLLAYGILATEKEISKIKELLMQTNLNQIVPLFKHSEKEKSFENVNEIILANPELLYRDKEDLKKYIEEIEIERENYNQQKQIAQQTAKEYYDALKEVESFDFTSESEKALYANQEQIIETKKNLEDKIKDIKTKSKELSADIETLKVSSEDLKYEKEKTLKLTRKFDEYLKQDAEYVNFLLELQQTESKINEANDMLENFEDCRQKYEESLANYQRDADRLENSLAKAIKEFDKYADSKETDVIEESEQELLGKLAAYEAKSTDISNLQAQITETDADIKDIKTRIENLNVKISDIENVHYSKIRVSELEEKMKILETDSMKINNDIKESEQKIAIKQDRIKTHKEKVPDENRFERENIKGNFKERKKSIQDEVKKLGEKIEAIRKKIMLFTILTERISGKVENIKDIKPDKNFKINVENRPGNIEENKVGIEKADYLENLVKDEIDEYLDSVKRQDTQIRKFDRNSNNKKGLYDDCEFDVVVKAARIAFDQIENMQRTFDGFYYLIERLEFNSKQLLLIKEQIQGKIDMLNHSKRDLIQQATFEARRIYDELPKITENSGIEIDGTRRKILEIRYEKIESDEAAKEKISRYITDCLESVIQSIKSGDEENKIRKNIAKLLATKELLNAIINLENVKVRSYKIDLNESNNKMKDWEEIKIENSGGEKFFAYFSLLVALISYSRKSSNNHEIFKSSEDSKVLIMDNPFGPITSGHLLKPMFEIAKKYNTQLICLSDIKEGAVLNSFNLVYLIKIRKNMTRQEFLEIEERNSEDLKINEKLEDAYLYMKENQVSLF